MKKSSVAALPIVFGLMMPVATPAQDPKTLKDELVETWENTSPQLPKGIKEIKHITPENQYRISTGDGHTVTVMFRENEDKCTGIQRIRGEFSSRPAPEAPPQDNKEDIFSRKVSLAAEAMPLREALATVARQAKLAIQIEADALKKVGVDVEQPVTVTIKNESLSEALGVLINSDKHLGAMYQLRRDKLIITTLEAYHADTESQLPDWLKVHYNRGLQASLDEDRNVVSLWTGEFLSDEELAKLKTLPKLRELDIGGAKHVTPAGLRHLADLASLRKLTLSSLKHAGQGLGDEAIGHLVGLKALRELSVNSCGTTDAGVRSLEALSQLTHLDLYGEVRLTDAALASIAKLKQLKYLSLNSYVGTEDGWMRFSKEATGLLLGLRELEHLHLVGQEIAPETLQFPRLQSLSLGTATVDDAMAARIATCRQLQTLHLVYTNITDAGLDKLADLPELRHLNLDSRVVTDAGIGHLKRLPKLQLVSLRATRLSDESLRHLAEIKTLTRIDLHGSGEPGFSPGRLYTTAGVQRLKALPNLRTLWLTLLELDGFRGLKELTQLRELTLVMTNIRDEELDALEDALPTTRIGASSSRKRLPRSVRTKDR